MMQPVRFGGSFRNIEVQAITSEDSVYDVQNFQTIVESAKLVRQQTGADVFITGKKVRKVNVSLPGDSKSVQDESEDRKFVVNVRITAPGKDNRLTDKADALFVDYMNEAGNDIHSNHYKAGSTNSSPKFYPANIRKVGKN